MHGQGIYVYANGDKYVGENGKKHGFGTGSFATEINIKVNSKMKI